jgi:hypothetical protein
MPHLSKHADSTNEGTLWKCSQCGWESLPMYFGEVFEPELPTVFLTPPAPSKGRLLDETLAGAPLRHGSMPPLANNATVSITQLPPTCPPSPTHHATFGLYSCRSM